MNGFFIYLTLAVVLWASSSIVLASPTRTICKSLLEIGEFTRVPDIKLELEPPFNSEEYLARFSDFHHRFGFLYRHGRILLVTPSADLSAQLVFGLSMTSGLPETFATPVRHGIPSHLNAMDITALLPPFARRMHGYFLPEGSNCWNFCLRYHDLSPSIRGSSSSEFRFHLEQPYAQKIQPQSTQELRSGDIVAYREKSGHEYHGAIFIAPGILMGKNGLGNDFVRLQDVQETALEYGKGGRDVAFFRIYPSLVPNPRDLELPTEFAPLWAAMEELEMKASNLTFEESLSRAEKNELVQDLVISCRSLTDRVEKFLRKNEKDSFATLSPVNYFAALVVHRCGSIRTQFK